jgi:RNA polymerase sigma-70 factor (ECF subfamily)
MQDEKNQGTKSSAERYPGFNEELISLIPYLRAFGRSLCRDRFEADDLTQETLTRAWQARNSYEPGTNMRAWLLKILRNSYYSDRRRARRQTAWNDETAERILVSNGSQSSSLDLSELHRAMATLPDEQREALILVGAGGVAYEEAATICGCALGTIKSRVARARRAVAAVLNGTGPALSGERTSGSLAAQDISNSLDALMGIDRLPAPNTDVVPVSGTKHDRHD